MKEENKTSREMNTIRRLDKIACQHGYSAFNHIQQWVSRGNSSAEFIESVMLEALTAAESDNERKDKEIDERYIEIKDLTHRYESAKRMVDNLRGFFKREISEKDQQIDELKRENDRLKDLNKELTSLSLDCANQIQDLQSTIDRMKEDHERDIEAVRNEALVSKQIGK